MFYKHFRSDGEYAIDLSSSEESDSASEVEAWLDSEVDEDLSDSDDGRSEEDLSLDSFQQDYTQYVITRDLTDLC